MDKKTREIKDESSQNQRDGIYKVMESFWKSFIEQKRKFQQIQPLNKISNLQQKSRINKLCLPLYPNSQVKTPNS